jgi:D-alanyl-D-alanine dipeptidase
VTDEILHESGASRGLPPPVRPTRCSLPNGGGELLLISSPAVKAIPVRECGDVLIDLRSTTGISFSAKRMSVNSACFLVRIGVARRLRQAAALLPRGIRLHFEEGFRPRALQSQLFSEYWKVVALQFPNLDYDGIFERVTCYVADPAGIPPHSTGAAVDVTLVNEEGAELQMGSSSDDTPTLNGDRNFTFCDSVGERERQNRGVLYYAMSTAGFVNYPAEWWHWSFGDQYWAAKTGKSYAIYGSCESNARRHC